MANDYIPRGDADFNTWQASIVSDLTANLPNAGFQAKAESWLGSPEATGTRGASQHTGSSSWHHLPVRVVGPSCGVMVLLLVVTAARARADAFMLKDGSCVVGEIYLRTSSNLFVRLPNGKTRNIPLDTLDRRIEGDSAECPDRSEQGEASRSKPVPAPSITRSEVSAKPAEESDKAALDKAPTERTAKIQEYVKKSEQETGKKAVFVQEGLYYLDLKDGYGPAATKTSRVAIHYTGYLMDGTRFASSKRGAFVEWKPVIVWNPERGRYLLETKITEIAADPFVVTLPGGLIRGLTEGLNSMKVGGNRKLVIAPEFGYGSQDTPPYSAYGWEVNRRIPPHSVLIFDVELVGIQE